MEGEKKKVNTVRLQNLSYGHKQAATLMAAIELDLFTHISMGASRLPRIAEALGLPPQFLTKILRRLTATGLVASQRGRSGGFRLSKAAESIALLDVVMPFEEPRAELDCALTPARHV